MENLKLGLSIAQVIIALVLILIVVLQPSKSEGLSGALSGGSETFFGRQKGRTREARLARATVWLSIIFVITTIALVVL